MPFKSSSALSSLFKFTLTLSPSFDNLITFSSFITSTSLAEAIIFPTNSLTPCVTSALISLESSEIDSGGLRLSSTVSRDTSCISASPVSSKSSCSPCSSTSSFQSTSGYVVVSSKSSSPVSNVSITILPVSKCSTPSSAPVISSSTTSVATATASNSAARLAVSNSKFLPFVH